MATVQITDTDIWMSHIEGDASLVAKLRSLTEDQTVRLRVDGKDGVWARVMNGSDGRPVEGIKPLGDAKHVWESFLRTSGEPAWISPALKRATLHGRPSRR
jgi:hypothetical protein